ncbi:hypothetical protein LINPERPRIM_LOCUS15518 [Linum perenne]
MAPG